jgi:hypothetical protein
MKKHRQYNPTIYYLKNGQTILVAYNPAFDDDDKRNHKDDKPTDRAKSKTS